MPQRQQPRLIVLNDKMHITKLRKLIVKQHDMIEKCKIEIPRLVNKKIKESNMSLLNKIENVITLLLQNNNKINDETQNEIIDDVHYYFEQIKASEEF